MNHAIAIRLGGLGVGCCAMMLWAVLALAGGCTPVEHCVAPGVVQPCICPDNSEGARVCGPEGQLLACECSGFVRLPRALPEVTADDGADTQAPTDDSTDSSADRPRASGASPSDEDDQTVDAMPSGGEMPAGGGVMMDGPSASDEPVGGDIIVTDGGMMADAGSQDTGGEDTGGEDTGGEDTGGEDTDGEDTGGEDTGDQMAMMDYAPCPDGTGCGMDTCLASLDNPRTSVCAASCSVASDCPLPMESFDAIAICDLGRCRFDCTPPLFGAALSCPLDMACVVQGLGQAFCFHQGL